MPQHTLVFFRPDLAGLVEIGRWRENAGIVEPAAYLHHADALGAPLENLADSGSSLLVDDQMVFILRVFAIAIRCPRSDELTTPLFHGQSSIYLAGYVLAVNLVDEIFQRDDVALLGALRRQGVEAVVDRYESNPKEREDTLQVVAGFLVVAAEAGKVLDHDAVDGSFPHLIHHLFKLRAVKVRPCSPVVTEQRHKLHVVLPLHKG